MKKSKILIGCLALFVGVSCTQDFEEINTNSNAPVAVQPELLLRQVIYHFGEQMSYEGFVAGDLLSQHRTAIDFNLFDRHALKSPQLGGNPWPIFYTNLRDNEILLKQSRSIETQRVYEGPALILKAYMAQGLTDLFGDVPYFEAFDGVSGTVTAAYDDQEVQVPVFISKIVVPAQHKIWSVIAQFFQRIVGDKISVSIDYKFAVVIF